MNVTVPDWVKEEPLSVQRERPRVVAGGIDAGGIGEGADDGVERLAFVERNCRSWSVRSEQR